MIVCILWTCIRLWTSFFEREFATSLFTTFVENFAERNILRSSSQRSLRPKKRGHKRLHSVRSGTELLTYCATLTLEPCGKRSASQDSIWVKPQD